MPVLAVLYLVSQSLWGARLLQPYEERSASGEWTLAIQPSSPDGKGPMQVRLARGGAPTWSGEFPWTFERAAVADDGTWVGYANGTSDDHDGLRIAVLDAQGVVRKQHDLPHTTWGPDSPPYPRAEGPVIVHDKADLILVRVLPGGKPPPYPYRAFHLSNGEAATDVLFEKPDSSKSAWHTVEGEARAVGDTGLTLLHWWVVDRRRPVPHPGGVFTLHDMKGETLWSLKLLEDYWAAPVTRVGDDRIERALKRVGAIAAAGPGSRFALHLVQERARVEYEVEQKAGRWEVREVGREPWELEFPESPAVAPLALVHQRTVALGRDAPAQGPLRDVVALGFTEQGELEIIRRSNGDAPSYARLRDDGELVFERDLGSALPSTAHSLHFFDLTGDRWLVQASGGEPPWVAVDVRTGEGTPAPLSSAQYECHVASLADGGYLALLSRTELSMFFGELDLVRANGTLAWGHRVAGRGPDDTALDRAVAVPVGLARTGEETFTLLGSSDLVRIDLDRKVLDAWDLEHVLGHDPGYIDGMLSDGKGGVLFEEEEVFHRIDASGIETGTFVPKRADGSRDASMDRLLATAPDGRLWTSDGQRLYRLAENGVADLVLGPELQADDLVEGDEAAIDVLGRACVQDRGSRSLHVFDADGLPLAVCRLAPEERPDDYVETPFASGPDGSLWIGLTEGFAHFDSRGTRLSGGAEPDWDTGADSTRREQGKELEAMQKRPDGRWLANVTARALLPDGQRALIEGPSEGPAALHRYTATGEPLRSIALPGGMSYWQASIGPRWVVAGDFGPSWVLVRLEDDRVFRFEPKPEDAASWHIGQTPDGKTLLLLNARRLELARYELP